VVPGALNFFLGIRIALVAILADELRSRTGDAALPYYDGFVQVCYSDGAITPQWMDRLSSAPARELLSEVLVDWDVIDDGVPLVPKPLVAVNTSEPPTPEAIAIDRAAQWHTILGDLPQSFLLDVLDGIVAAVRTQRRNKRRSTNLSLTA
jgi:hypothetical protein